MAVNTTLTTLKLGVSLKSTPVEGMRVIFRALKVNTSLKHLHLAGYTMGNEGTQLRPRHSITMPRWFRYIFNDASLDLQMRQFQA